MSVSIITHPANVATIRKAVPVRHGIDMWDNNDVKIIENPHMEKEAPTGQYILPDGKVVPPGEVRVQEKFTSYGPDDIWFLEWAGIIRKEMKMVFFMMEDPPETWWRTAICPMPVFNPRSMIKSSSV